LRVPSNSVDQRNVEKAYELEAMKFLLGVAKRTDTKDSIKATIFKICSYLSRFGNYL